MNISGSPTLSQLTIIGNRSDWQGGGIYNANGNPVLTNVTITGNQAGYGGGMYNNLADTSPVLTNVMIRNNMALEDGGRSEERRVGKEGRSGWWAGQGRRTKAIRSRAA